jgi:CheY-like chemotaxis protein
VSASPQEQRSILLVDDQENDVLLTRLALQRAGLDLPVYSVPGGMEAIAYLNADPPYQDRFRYPLPASVLLDIQMPHMDGFEVLRWVRKQPNVANLPVVMLTGSRTKSVVETARLLGATSFFVKDFANAAELSRSIDSLLTG